MSYDERRKERLNEFEKDLEHLINKHSLENGSNTPDFIIARYLRKCLEAYDEAATAKNNWYKK